MSGKKPAGHGEAPDPSHLTPDTSCLAEKIPLLLLCAASCFATLFAQREAIAPLPWSMRLANVPVSYVVYLKQLFYPAGLAAYYPHPEGGLALWKIIASILLLLAITLAAVLARRTQPWLFTGWFWYLGMLVPVIGLLQVGSQAHADRYTYLPQIGLSLALTWTVAELGKGWRYERQILGSTAAVILIVLLFIARSQTACWANSQSLWTHALACTSNNVVAHNNLGAALLRRGNVDDAIVHQQRALELKPDYADAHINLGNALLQKEKVNEAIAHYHRALEIAPAEAGAHFNLGNALLRKSRIDEAIGQYQKALELKPAYAEAHNHLGNALLQKGSLNEAIRHYQTALELNPGYTKVRNNLGFALLQKGNTDEAIGQLQKALRTDAANPEAHYNLGNAFAQKQNFDEAVACYRKALQLEPRRADIHYQLARVLLRDPARAIPEFQSVLQLEPGHSGAQNDLAWLWATAPVASLRNGIQAVDLARQANQSAGGGNPVFLKTLAAACAEAGLFSEAVRHAQQAIALAQAAGRNDLVAELGSQLKLYEAGTPFHQSQ